VDWYVKKAASVPRPSIRHLVRLLQPTTPQAARALWTALSFRGPDRDMPGTKRPFHATRSTQSSAAAVLPNELDSSYRFAEAALTEVSSYNEEEAAQYDFLYTPFLDPSTATSHFESLAQFTQRHEHALLPHVLQQLDLIVENFMVSGPSSAGSRTRTKTHSASRGGSASSHSSLNGSDARPITHTYLGNGKLSVPPEADDMLQVAMAQAIMLGLRPSFAEVITPVVHVLYADSDWKCFSAMTPRQAVAVAQAMVRVVSRFYPELARRDACRKGLLRNGGSGKTPPASPSASDAAFGAHAQGGHDDDDDDDDENHEEDDDGAAAQPSESVCPCIVLATQYQVLRSLSETEPDMVKNGLHFVWPEILVTPYERAFLMEAWQAELNETFGTRDTPLNSVEAALRDSLDESAYNSGCRMMGNVKIDFCGFCHSRGKKRAALTEKQRHQLMELRPDLNGMQASAPGLMLQPPGAAAGSSANGASTKTSYERELCKLKGYCRGGRVDIGRAYMPIFVLDMEGYRDRATEQHLLKDLIFAVKKTSIRSHAMEATRGFVVPAHTPIPKNLGAAMSKYHQKLLSLGLGHIIAQQPYSAAMGVMPPAAAAAAASSAVSGPGLLTRASSASSVGSSVVGPGEHFMDADSLSALVAAAGSLGPVAGPGVDVFGVPYGGGSGSSPSGGGIMANTESLDVAYARMRKRLLEEEATSSSSFSTLPRATQHDGAWSSNDIPSLAAIKNAITCFVRSKETWGHAAYERVVLPDIRVDLNGHFMFIKADGMGSTYCQNAQRYHSRSQAYFVLTRNGIYQGCRSDKLTSVNPRTRRKCKGYKSVPVGLPRNSDLERMLPRLLMALRKNQPRTSKKMAFMDTLRSDLKSMVRDQQFDSMLAYKTAVSGQGTNNAKGSDARKRGPASRFSAILEDLDRNLLPGSSSLMVQRSTSGDSSSGGGSVAGGICLARMPPSQETDMRALQVSAPLPPLPTGMASTIRVDETPMGTPCETGEAWLRDKEAAYQAASEPQKKQTEDELQELSIEDLTKLFHRRLGVYIYHVTQPKAVKALYQDLKALVSHGKLTPFRALFVLEYLVEREDDMAWMQAPPLTDTEDATEANNKRQRVSTAAPEAAATALSLQPSTLARLEGLPAFMQNAATKDAKILKRLRAAAPLAGAMYTTLHARWKARLQGLSRHHKESLAKAGHHPRAALTMMFEQLIEWCLREYKGAMDTSRVSIARSGVFRRLGGRGLSSELIFTQAQKLMQHANLGELDRLVTRRGRHHTSSGTRTPAASAGGDVPSRRHETPGTLTTPSHKALVTPRLPSDMRALYAKNRCQKQ
jgi:hypothetical protein